MEKYHVISVIEDNKTDEIKTKVYVCSNLNEATKVALKIKADNDDNLVFELNIYKVELLINVKQL